MRSGRARKLLRGRLARMPGEILATEELLRERAEERAREDDR
ncbi:MAG TPA: hypothetical protein VGH89_33520 [Pseudonocardia sp.]